jgi:hypothetical protein
MTGKMPTWTRHAGGSRREERIQHAERAFPQPEEVQAHGLAG